MYSEQPRWQGLINKALVMIHIEVLKPVVLLAFFTINPTTIVLLEYLDHKHISFLVLSFVVKIPLASEGALYHCTQKLVLSG